MCLVYEEKDVVKTAKYKNRIRTIKAYKIVKTLEGKMFSPLMREEIFFGINESSRLSTKLTKSERLLRISSVRRFGEIECGFHLYLKKNIANINLVEWQLRVKESYKIMIAKIKPEDVVSTGRNSEIVCTKYEIRPEDNKE